MTLTDVIAKRTVYGKSVIVTDNSSSPALSVNQNGSGESAFFTAAPPLSGTLRLFWPDATLGGDFVYNGGSDGVFLFKDNGGKTAFMGGDIGIGVLNATEKLDVNGKIKSKNESIVNGATAEFKFTSLRTNNLNRWDIGSDNTVESGANVGSDFFIHRFSDAGTFIDRVMSITRSNGYVGIGTASPVNKLQVVGSFGRGAPVTKTGDFTLSDTENWIIVNKGSSCTVTLPAASSWLGREFTIKVITAHNVVSASSNIVPANSATPGINILSATAGAWATLVSDGTNWVIMANS